MWHRARWQYVGEKKTYGVCERGGLVGRESRESKRGRAWEREREEGKGIGSATREEGGRERERERERGIEAPALWDPSLVRY